jgi:hypothetical protein
MWEELVEIRRHVLSRPVLEVGCYSGAYVYVVFAAAHTTLGISVTANHILFAFYQTERIAVMPLILFP